MAAKKPVSPNSRQTQAGFLLGGVLRRLRDHHHRAGHAPGGPERKGGYRLLAGGHGLQVHRCGSHAGPGRLIICFFNGAIRNSENEAHCPFIAQEIQNCWLLSVPARTWAAFPGWPTFLMWKPCWSACSMTSPPWMTRAAPARSRSTRCRKVRF